jgi:hypothetical protein
MARLQLSGKVLLALAVSALFALSACSGDDDDASTSDTESQDASAGEPDDSIATDASDSDEGGAGSGTDGGGNTVTDLGEIDLVAAQVDRKIVYRGDIASEVDDVASAVRSARDEVAAEGGYVFGQEITEGSARVVLKVPSVRFDAAFDAVAGIGEVTSQKIEADDVSEQFTDLESRRATLEASIVRLRGFLEGTTNVDEISRLESELTHREAERDVIAGQLRVLTDRTSFGTISVVFTVPDEVDATAAEDDDESSGPPGFGRGLEVGWDGVVFAAALAATITGFLLPMLPVLLLAGALAWWLRRRRQLEISRLVDQPS